MFIAILIYFVFPLITLAYFYVKQKYSYWSYRNVAHPKPKFPLGNFSGIGSKYHITEIVQKCYKKYKKDNSAFGIYLTLGPMLIVNDLDVVKQILIKDFNKFHDRGVFYNEQNEPISAHLFAIEGEKWRYLRNKLSPTFTSGKIKAMFETMASIGEQFVDVVNQSSDGQTAIDIKDLCQRFTSDVIGSCAFGLEYDSLHNDNAKILEMSDRIFRPTVFRNIYILFMLAFKDLSVKLRLKQFPEDVADYFSHIIEDTVVYREKNNVTRLDFLNLLIQLKNKGIIEDDEGNHNGADSHEKLTMNEIIAQSFIFFFAGFETSSTTLSFALFNLATNPDAQEKARQEVQEVLSRHDGKITYTALQEMKYIEQVINETLRIFPPVGLLIRIASESYKIPDKDLTIDKGLQVLIPVHAIQNDPEIYPNPDKFDPDRFTPENIQSRHHCAFIPFGEGPRNCIGMRFAMLEVKFGIVQLLKTLKFTVSDKMQLPVQIDKRSQTAQVKGGIWLNATKNFTKK
uniref:Putative cytochrome n=1 Tax=Corethrella appendiculata TaxID=1370023 RepID=U5EZ76_9DIPT